MSLQVNTGFVGMSHGLLMDDDLWTAACDGKANLILELHPWIAKIKYLDNTHITQCKCIAEAIEDHQKANKKTFHLLFSLC